MNFLNRKQQRKIHAMRRQIFGPDDEAYREMLWGVAKVKSSSDLSSLKASLVIEHLQKCLGEKPPGRGYRRLHSKAPAPQGPQAGTPAPRITGRQLWEIRELWARVSRGPDQVKELRNFLARMRLPQDPAWLSLTQAQKVIEALKAMAMRQGAGIRGQK